MLLALLGGCAIPHVQKPLTVEYGGMDDDSRGEFWYQLAEHPVACNDEAFHALLLHFFKKDPGNYAARVTELKHRKMLPGGFDRPADEAIQRGTLAVALARVLKIKGGLMLSVLGPTPRYATRELQYIGIYPPSSPEQVFSGTELVGIMGRVEDYQRGNVDFSASALPDQAAPVRSTGR
jgi:hypothetical protein